MPQGRSNKKGADDAVLAEIEQRATAGETSTHIAQALQDKGLDISHKSVSRRRLELGLRRRSVKSSKGERNARLAISRPERRNDPSLPPMVATKLQRKAQIIKWTNEGLSASTIVQNLTALGVNMKAGESGIYRLQTLWGLTPADRPDGRAPYLDRIQKKFTTEEKAARHRQRQREKETARSAEQSTNWHYPNNCSLGPNSNPSSRPMTMSTLPQPLFGSSEETLDTTGGNGDQDVDVPVSSLPLSGSSPAQPQQRDVPRTRDGPPVDIARELMAAELLVDLAKTALEAATHLRTLLLERQTLSSNSHSHPADDRAMISEAKRKVREAASVVLDLANDAPAAQGTG